MRLRIAVPLLIVFAACAGAGSDSDQHAPAEIAGYWVSDAYQTQLGRATTDFCFRKNGTFESHFKSEGATFDDRGRYRVGGGKLILEGTNGTFSYDLTHSTADMLVVDEGGEEPRRYRRGKQTC